MQAGNKCENDFGYRRAKCRNLVGYGQKKSHTMVTADGIEKCNSGYSNSSSFMLYSQLKISSEVACFLFVVMVIFF